MWCLPHDNVCATSLYVYYLVEPTEDSEEGTIVPTFYMREPR